MLLLGFGIGLKRMHDDDDDDGFVVIYLVLKVVCVDHYPPLHYLHQTHYVYSHSPTYFVHALPANRVDP